MQPKVSVIVIGYNIEKYVNRCLDSLVCQKYENFEIIFVNDGSNDKTLSKVRKYEKQYDNVQVIDKLNGGIVSARKTGLLYATGEYVCFVDGDDWVVADMISSLVDGLKSSKIPVDMVQSNFYAQESNGAFHIDEQRPFKEYLVGDDFLHCILDDTLAHYMFAKLYNREFLIRSGYMDLMEVTVAEDLMTNSIVGFFKPCVRLIDPPVYYYRYNQNSCTRDGSNKLLEQIKTLKYTVSWFKSHGGYTDNALLLDYQWFSYALVYIPNMSVNPRVKQEIIKDVKPYIKNYKKNEYSLKAWEKIGKIEKIIFRVFYYFPAFGKLYTNTYDFLKKILKKNEEDIYKEKAIKGKKKYDKEMTCLTEYSEKDRKIYLLGTSSRSNIGDHVIAFSELQFLDKYFGNEYKIIEITEDCYYCEKDNLQNIIKNEDLIFVTGGGFLGDLWMYEENMVRDIIYRFKNNRVLIFPQTVYFNEYTEDNPDYLKSIECYKSHNRLKFYLRDQKSYLFFVALLGENKCGLFPDMALLASIFSIDKTVIEKKQVCLCFRKDKEKALTDYTQYRIKEYLKANHYEVCFSSTLAEGINDGDISSNDREKALKDKLLEFGSKRIILTDRLHGMILSCLSGTPCIAFDNASQKVSGVFEAWMTPLDYVQVVDSYDEFVTAFNRLVSAPEFKYSNSYLMENEIMLAEDIKKTIRELVYD